VRARRLLHRQELRKEKAQRTWIWALAYSPDGKTLAAGGLTDVGGPNWPSGTVWICDAATGQELRGFVLDGKTDGWAPIMGLAFLNEGKYLAAGTRAFKVGSRVFVWETATGKRVAYLTNGLSPPAGGDGPEPVPVWEINRSAPTLVTSPDGRLVARNGHWHDVNVWETATGKRRLILAGHDDAIFRVAFAPDGRTLASASADETIRLWDLATGKELLRLRGHRGVINSLVFSADGKVLISAGHDTTILFWDVAAVTRRERAVERPTGVDLGSLWADLASSDALRAHGAIARLTSTGPAAVAELRDRVRPASRVEAARIDQMMRDLDSGEYAVRSRATEALDQLGELAGPALRKALQSPPSPEVRRRVEQLLSKLDDPCPAGDHLRSLRAIEVLEHIAIPEARQLLEKLADGAPEARLTREAKVALQRLAKRRTNAP
jgi:hypothetical protein